MGTAPSVHRFRESRHGAQPGRDRGIYQHGNHGPYPSGLHSSSVPLAQKSTWRRSTLPIKPYEALIIILYWTRQRALETSYESRLWAIRSPSPWGLIMLSRLGYAPEIGDGRVQRCFEEFDRFLEEDWTVESSLKKLYEYFTSWTPWVNNDKIRTQSDLKLASEMLHEEIRRLDVSWNRGTWVKFQKAAKSSHVNLARVFEYRGKVGLISLHKSHAHPDDILTPRNTDDDIDIISNDNMSRKHVETWKNGSGRKKTWRTAPRLKLTKKDGLRLLECLQWRKAILRSHPMPLRDSELFLLIKQAPNSFSIPKVVLEHGLVGRCKSQQYPKPSTVKKFARRLDLHTSNMHGRRTQSKPFSSMADRFVDGDEAGGSDGADDEEIEYDSSEPGSSYWYFEGGLLFGMGDAM